MMYALTGKPDVKADTEIDFYSIADIPRLGRGGPRSGGEGGIPENLCLYKIFYKNLDFLYLLYTICIKFCAKRNFDANNNKQKEKEYVNICYLSNRGQTISRD